MVWHFLTFKRVCFFESLRHVAATPPRVCGEADRSVVMRSPCAGATLDPPLWKVPNKLSLRLSVSLWVYRVFTF